MKSQTELWTWAQLCAALNLPEVAGPNVSRVVFDSRTATADDLFVALPGDPGPRFNPSYRSQVDGHDFVLDALRNGAVGALVHKPIAGLDEAAPILQIGDTYDGLWVLAAAARLRLTGDVVAVTGSNGKTTFKTFLAAALDGYASPGSFNNHIGVPSSLINASTRATSWVFEVGTNHPGEIASLVDLVAPDFAVLLNVHNAHIEHFESRRALIEEKINIFNGIESKSNKICEESIASELVMGTMKFGHGIDCDARHLSLSGDMLQARILGHRVTARVPGGGIHRAQTLLAVLLVTRLLERDVARACELPGELVPQGRGNVVRVGEIDVIDDSYNANPASMKAAINTFIQDSAPRRKIAVLGAMGELGTESEAAHREIAESFAAVDDVFAVGRGFEHCEAPHWHESAGDELLAELIATLQPGDRVLVKGSNSVFWARKFVQGLVERLG